MRPVEWVEQIIMIVIVLAWIPWIFSLVDHEWYRIALLPDQVQHVAAGMTYFALMCAAYAFLAARIKWLSAGHT